jgi:DNA-binding response OmpR family regulator
MSRDPKNSSVRAQKSKSQASNKEEAARRQVNAMKRKPRILIVDDEPGLVRLLALMLTTRYEVRSIYDSTQALEAAVEFKPHLILLDWVMPKMHGGDVAQQIRADARVCDTRILFHSAVLSKRDESGGLAGLPAIAKPAGVKELVAAIEQQMSEFD